MKLCIDLEECKKQNIPIGTALFTAALYLKVFIDDTVFDDVCRRGFVEYDGFDLMRKPINPQITQKGVDTIESLFLNSEFKPPKDAPDRFDILADKLRELYPEGKKAGTSLMWRNSTKGISKRLKSFVKRFGDDFTDEQMVEATKRYIASFNGDYRFMQVLEYFIWKEYTVEGSKEARSQLLSYLSNDSKEERQDWTSTLN